MGRSGSRTNTALTSVSSPLEAATAVGIKDANMIADLFDNSGKMLTAIRPPESIIPYRNGTESFSAASPPFYIDGGDGPLPNPEDPDTGRDNNHGFEGLTASEDGKTLWVLLQAATVQEGVSHMKLLFCTIPPFLPSRIRLSSQYHSNTHRI